MKPAAAKFVRKIHTEMAQGLLLKPQVELFLYDAKWPEFSLYFPAREADRKPDGYFHPSTHPTMTERQLFYYLTQPDLLKPEILEPSSILAITMGTAVHAFIQMCMLPGQLGLLLPPPPGNCRVCHLPTSPTPVKGTCWEHGALDEETKSRGHMDGLVMTPRGLAGFEFKTSNNDTLRSSGITDLNVEAYRKKWPYYYAQNQDYMRITGLREFVVLFMGMGFPWPLIEIHIPRDEAFIMELTNKYRRVLSAAERGVVPFVPCCNAGSTLSLTCQARAVCPNGAAL